MGQVEPLLAAEGDVEPADLALFVATLCGRGIEPHKPADPLEHHAAAG